MDITTPPLAPLDPANNPASPVAPITPAGTPGASPAANEHMLPLQHLLLSDRAQRLSSLDTKAIIYRVSRRPLFGAVRASAISSLLDSP
jgi:hypothetical protein